MQLSLGVRRSLQRCAQPEWHFRHVGMDQRGSLINAINATAPSSVSYRDIIALKRDVIGVLSPLAARSCWMWNMVMAPVSPPRTLAGQTGLLLALEKSGYDGDPTERRTALLENWSVERTAKSGANGVKLLIYYHPDAPELCRTGSVVAEVAQQCHDWELPLFVEPLHYSLNLV